MKLNYVLLFALLSVVCACHEEGTLEPLSTEMSLRFEFPEGETTWDKDIADIAEKYKTYLIYKNLTTDDFNQSWKGGGDFAGMTMGSPLNDEQAVFCTNFMKDHVFAFLNPKVMDRVLPVYIYMAYNVYSEVSFGSFTFCAPIEEKSGMDFWCYCLESDPETIIPPYEPIVRPRTSMDFKLRRGKILKSIIEKIIAKGNIEIPAVFTADFDYVTEVKYMLGTENDKNYYKKRGFADQFSGYNSSGSLWSVSRTTPQKNFLNYIILAARYSRDSVAILNPPSEFPKIIQYYDYTVEYLKTNYNWDITKIAEMPIIENQ